MTNLAPQPGSLPTALRPAGLSPGSPLNGASGGPRTTPLLRYYSAVKRTKWLVLLLTLVGLGAGYLMSRLRPQQFVVRAKLQIAPTDNPTFQSEQWTIYLRSYSIIDPVVFMRRLYIKGPKGIGGAAAPLGPSGPARALFNGFSLATRSTAGTYRLKISPDGHLWDLTNTLNSRKEHGNVGDSIGRAFGFRWLPVIERRWIGQTFDFDVMTPREAADALNGQLEVSVVPFRNPRFIILALTGQDADETAETLNQLMDVFVAAAGVTKRHDVTSTAQGLDSQLTLARIKLDADDRALQQYQIKTITLPRQELPVAPGLQSTTPGAYTAWVPKRNEVDQLKKQRRDLASAVAKLERGEGAADQYSMNPVTKLSPELMIYVNELVQSEQQYQSLHARYTDEAVTLDGKINMPRLIEDIHRLRAVTIPNYTREILNTLNSLIATADSEVATGRDELQGIPSRSITEAELQRNRTFDEGIVGDLTKQYHAAKAREVSSIPDVAVLDPAVAPLLPTKNRTVVLILMGAVMGLGAGLGLALLHDMTDKRVRYADQITSGLGLTILGVIPEIRRAKGEEPSADEAAQVIESFRSVRLNLSHALGEGSVLFTISSPSPGDGKSLIASNLALSFAESGYRTLLIDGDVRRGELHRTFGTERRPGLLDFLAGELPMDQLLRATTHSQLMLITGGSRKRNAPELLGTPRMRDLLAAMRDQFDVIIVDTPPLGAGSIPLSSAP